MKRWYGHPQWETASGGKRNPRYDGATPDGPSSDSTRQMIMPPEKAATRPDSAGPQPPPAAPGVAVHACHACSAVLATVVVRSLISSRRS